MHELPLVFFTVLGQLAAGTLLCANITLLLDRQGTHKIAIKSAHLFALIMMVVAMLFASLHLGKPLRALNVIYGIGRSPMSNEIFTFGLLLGVTLLCVLVDNFTSSSKTATLSFISKLSLKISQIPHFRVIMAISLIIISLFLVWTMVVIYTLPTVPTWNTPYTPLQMYTSMFILGGIASHFIGLSRIGHLLFIIGTALLLLFKVPYYNAMQEITPALASEQLIWISIEIGLITFALIFMLTYARTAKKLPLKKQYAIYITVFTFVFIGELSGRIAFYNLWTIGM